MADQLKRVLIVDDEPHFVHYYLDCLKGEGVEVKLLTRPNEARDHIKENSSLYDVIVVDLIMSLLPSAAEMKAEAQMPATSYLESGLAMGRWVLDAIPKNSNVVVLTNRDPEKIDWLSEYRTKYARFMITTKQDAPAFDFYDFLSAFLTRKPIVNTSLTIG